MPYNPFMELSENALKVLKARYLLKDENGQTIETPEEMFERIARTVAGAEKLYAGDAPCGKSVFSLSSLPLSSSPTPRPS